MASTVLKIGGELIGRPDDLLRVAREIVRLALAGPLVVVHGGGRTIDAELTARGIPTRAVDGVRVTDTATLDVVVSVLAGLVNTRLVAAVSAAGGRAVGLTGADAFIGLVEKAPLHTSTAGTAVDLGLVGAPIPAGAPALLVELLAHGYVPIVASIGASIDGALYNVNADTWAAHLAVALGARRLLVAGGTPGVLDAGGRTIPAAGPDAVARLVESGQANAGMIAKLVACRQAAAAGVPEVRIVDGRGAFGSGGATGTSIAASDDRPEPSTLPVDEGRRGASRS